jgi:hypothetical protein
MSVGLVSASGFASDGASTPLALDDVESGLMLVRILAVTTALLALLVIQQCSSIGDLRTQMTDVQAQTVSEARASVATSMEGQNAETQRVMTWLNDFYKSTDGLQRPEGLWIDGHPDFQGIGMWVFDVYLRDRLKGQSEEQARRSVEDAIKHGDEWRSKHRAP